MRAVLDSDTTVSSWLDRWVPAMVRPYLYLMRLDRPIGTWLLLFPCWWSVVMAWPGDAAPDWHLLELFVLFGLGSVIMRGAGCVINDLTDHRFDGMVARTAGRPLPSGAVSRRQTFLFLGFLLFLGLLVLWQLNPFARLVCLASIPFVVIYPFMKRITWWPQFWLGIAFNWGAIAGWAAVRGELSLAPFLLHLAGIFWSLGYDTIYAHQDKDDDRLIGVKSSALRLGDRTKPWVFGFYSLTVGLTAAAGWAAGLGPWFYPMLAVAGLQLWWQALTVDINNGPDCLSKFRSTRWYGWLCLLSFVAGHV